MAEINGIDFGPLAALVGTWKGDKGMDRSPEPDGTEENPYFETITFDVVGDVKNAGEQILAVIRYHQVVSRKADNQVFHDEIGYWMWDAAAGVVMQSLAIPRAVTLLAGGKAQATDTKFEVKSAVDDPDWGIAQSPFMRDKAKTVAFEHTMDIRGDELVYSETTHLQIYGKSFDHTDENVLKRS